MLIIMELACTWCYKVYSSLTRTHDTPKEAYMPTVKQVVKHDMLTYPTIMPNPVSVLIHLFCVIGNGYEWVEGELTDSHTDYSVPVSMKYPDPREYDADSPCAATFKLQDAAEAVQMNFIASNIDAIVEADLNAVYFDQPSSSYLTKSICIKYAHGLHFPDDIKPDWAACLERFLNYWLYALNVEYGTAAKGDDRSWWPKDVVEARQVILDARVRLYPLAHDGQTYEHHQVKMKALITEFFPKLEQE